MNSNLAWSKQALSGFELSGLSGVAFWVEQPDCYDLHY